MSKTVLTSFILIFSSISARAQDPLLSQSGASRRFNSCAIYQDKVEIQLGQSYSNKLRARYPHKLSAQQVENYQRLSDQAIAARSEAFYRWDPYNIQFQATGTSGPSMPFFAKGFLNYSNQSVAAKKLIHEIKSICNRHSDFLTKLGDYNIQLDMFDDTLEGKLKLDSVDFLLNPFLTVKFLSSEDDYDSINTRLEIEDQKLSLQLKFIKNELIVKHFLLEGQYDQYGNFQGIAYSLPDRLKQGTFQAEKLGDQ